MVAIPSTLLLHGSIVLMMVCEWASILYDLPLVNYVFKPSVVLAMCVATLFTSNNGATAFHRFMVIAFFFSMLGDIFLMLPDSKKYFLFGLVSFATSHIAFIIGFFENSSFNQQLFLNFSLPLGVVLAVFDTFIYKYLVSQPEFPSDLQIPVLVYVILISTMAFAASMRDKTSKKSYILAIAGAFFFICSDSLLSQGMFVPGFNSKIVRLLIMITYYVAEELIFIAALDHFEYSKANVKANNTKPKHVKQE